MGIRFSDFTAETAGAPREGLAVSKVRRCQEYHHLASLKLCPICTHTHTRNNNEVIMVCSSYLPPVWTSTNARTFKLSNTQLVCMDHCRANPKGPCCSHWWKIYAHTEGPRRGSGDLACLNPLISFSTDRWQPTCQGAPLKAIHSDPTTA